MIFTGFSKFSTTSFTFAVIVLIHTMVDLVAEFPSSNVVTTFIKGGLVSTWRSFADITREGAAAVGVAAEGVDEAEFVELVPFGLSIVFDIDDGEIGAMATFE